MLTVNSYSKYPKSKHMRKANINVAKYSIQTYCNESMDHKD